ncbi:pentapeptide repeat-containing protein [Actinoplanes sp. NPDC051411]|uniref:pentapeptide repeat-containing protein n=1 Tax=Actinoplanes sp. NPDC051411 TaxID=3155522 RepID=UPI0034274AA5
MRIAGPASTRSLIGQLQQHRRRPSTTYPGPFRGRAAFSHRRGWLLLRVRVGHRLETSLRAERLHRARLSGKRLGRARLSGERLRRARLSGERLRRARLSG